MVGDLRIADRAEIDRVEPAQRIEPVLGHHAAVLAIIVRAPGEGLDREAEAAVARLDRLHHLEPRRDDFLADTVRRDGGNLVLAHDFSIPLAR